MLSNKKLTLINIISVLILQLCTIASGFIVPKIILSYFGSEVNGLVSSISQFLNYIQLLEGGLSGVVMAALYKALANNDNEKVSSIIKAVDSFFKKIALIYVAYAVVLAVVYPFIVHNDFNYWYIFTLILIIAISLFIQYFFSLTYRLLITSDRRGFLVSIAQIVFIIVNVVLVIVSVKIYPNIHLLKLISAIAFIVQPIIFGIYVRKHYAINKKAEKDTEALKQRWDGFGQNLAYFVHSNTDVVLLTLCVGLSTVSIYSVYLMVINAIQSLLIAVSGAIKPIFGNIISTRSKEEVNKIFDYYELGMNIITTVAFSCCIVLIVPFVGEYTKDITDANYIQPIFAIIMCVAEAMYCYRDPFVAVAYSVGHFKQTAKYAYLEALINIVISLSLVFVLGLIGVAIGTLVSMVFRMVMHTIYVKKNILNRPIYKWAKGLLISIIAGGGSIVLIMFCIKFTVASYLDWFIYVLISAAVIVPIVIVLTFIVYHKTVITFIKSYLCKGKKEVDSENS